MLLASASLTTKYFYAKAEAVDAHTKCVDAYAEDVDVCEMARFSALSKLPLPRPN